MTRSWIRKRVASRNRHTVDVWYDTVSLWSQDTSRDLGFSLHLAVVKSFDGEENPDEY